MVSLKLVSEFPKMQKMDYHQKSLIFLTVIGSLDSHCHCHSITATSVNSSEWLNQLTVEIREA